MLQSSICSWGFVNFYMQGVYVESCLLDKDRKHWLNISSFLYKSPTVFLPQGFSCLQVVEEVFSIQKHVFQCIHYHSVNLVIWLSFLSVVLHKEDAVQWNAQLLVESFNLSQSNNMLISNRTAMNKHDIYAEKWHCAKTPKCTFSSGTCSYGYCLCPFQPRDRLYQLWWEQPVGEFLSM